MWVRVRVGGGGRKEETDIGPCEFISNLPTNENSSKEVTQERQKEYLTS